MLVIEQLLSPHSHSHGAHLPVPNKSSQASTSSSSARVEFDVELGELERAEGITPEPVHVPSIPSASPEAQSRSRAYPLTFGLVIHALADGLALGSSALSGGGSETGSQANAPFFSGLSIVVFLALIIHKGIFSSLCNESVTKLSVAPTALALTTSLLTIGLPRSECKRHIAVFSASTPVGALVTYLLLTLFSTGSPGNWPGTALLVSVSLRFHLFWVVISYPLLSKL